jgi:hypothetical protein
MRIISTEVKNADHVTNNKQRIAEGLPSNIDTYIHTKGKVINIVYEGSSI